jgi:16S rRNA (guanine527-N7)-methyltransferase
MNEIDVKEYLKNEFQFKKEKIDIIENFSKYLLEFNQKYNLIGKSTENDVWNRHILDSAQIIKYINFNNPGSLADLGSGAGFPGLILAIYNDNQEFHVKLYEKSNIKCNFMQDCIDKLSIRCEVMKGSYVDHAIESNYIICRAFKKLPEIMRISREIAQKNHKLIILKGKNAQIEINKALKEKDFKYRLHDSITDDKSKIIVCNIIKSE